MPVEITENYQRRRLIPPSHFIKGSFRTVPISHTEFKNRFRKKGTKAIVGKFKSKYKRRYKWGVQSILTPRKKR